MKKPLPNPFDSPEIAANFRGAGGRCAGPAAPSFKRQCIWNSTRGAAVGLALSGLGVSPCTVEFWIAALVVPAALIIVDSWYLGAAA